MTVHLLQNILASWVTHYKYQLHNVDSDNGGTLNSIIGLTKISLMRAPTSSSYVSDLGGKNDEIHVVVIDEDGEITGTAGEVLETFPFLSVAKNAKRRRNFKLLQRRTKVTIRLDLRTVTSSEDSDSEYLMLLVEATGAKSTQY